MSELKLQEHQSQQSIQPKQLATDSISKTVTLESSPCETYSNEDIDHEPDDSEIYGLPQNYEIGNAPNYDRSHLIKIVQYLHNRMTKDNELIQQLKLQHQELSNKLANVIPSAVDDSIAKHQIQQLEEQITELHNELARRSERDHNLIEAVMKLGNQVRQAGLVPVARISMATTSPTSTTTSAAEA